jgi:hypothetical protein
MVDREWTCFFSLESIHEQTQINRLSESCETNIRHCAMNIKMSFLWKKMFSTQQPTIGGIPQGWLMKLGFKS